MDNKIEHFFVLKPDGKIGWIEKMPIDKYFDPPNPSNFHYRAALQSAIDNAVEVSNQEEVFATMAWRGLAPLFNEPYSLQCSVEKIDNVYGIKIDNPVALVTFSQPEREETQEELEDGVQLTLSMNLGTFGRVIKALKTDPELWEEVKDELTRLSKEFETRKTP